VSDGEVELRADRTRGLPVVDPEDRALVISCGAALFYLRVAMRHFGYEDEVEILPDPDDPDLLARVRSRADHEEAEEERALFEAIPKRRSNRRPFENRPVPGRLLSALQAAAWEEEVWLHLVEDEPAKHTIAELIAEGDRIQLADKSFRRELASWGTPQPHQEPRRCPRLRLWLRGRDVFSGTVRDTHLRHGQRPGGQG
jgi:hypothetical protein